MANKKQLAKLLVSKFYSDAAAQHELEQFEQVFSRHELPDDMPEYSWSQSTQDEENAGLISILYATNLFPSKKEIRRLIEQGAEKIDSEKASDANLTIDKPSDSGIVIQAGKRKFFKLIP